MTLASAPRTRGAVTLPDGRRLAYAEHGPEDGWPTLFFSGAALGASLGVPAAELERHHLRLVAIDRPGLGGSDPAPDRTLSSWPDDVRALLRAMALERPAALAYSQGAPFALVCAAAELVAQVVVVAGTDELASPAIRDRLVPDVRALVERAASDPAGTEAYLATLDAERFHAMVLAMSAPDDRALYESPEFAPALRAAIAEGFAQGSGGYARDTLLSMSPWPFRAESIAVPVTLVYGGADTSPVHSPDFGATLVTRFRNAHRVVLGSGGGAMLWTEAGWVLSALGAIREGFTQKP